MAGDLEKDLGVIKTEAASKPRGSLRAPKEGIGAEECQTKYQAPGRSLRLLTPAAEVERVGRRETRRVPRPGRREVGILKGKHQL